MLYIVATYLSITSRKFDCTIMGSRILYHHPTPLHFLQLSWILFPYVLFLFCFSFFFTWTRYVDMFFTSLCGGFQNVYLFSFFQIAITALYWLFLLLFFIIILPCSRRLLYYYPSKIPPVIRQRPPMPFFYYYPIPKPSLINSVCQFTYTALFFYSIHIRFIMDLNFFV